MISRETTPYYTWCLQQLHLVMIETTGLGDIATIMTDRELALMNAISIVFPSSSHQLCIWHIQKNTRAHLKNIPKSEDFFKLLDNLIYNEEEKECVMDQINDMISEFPEAKKYMKDTWLPYIKSWLGIYTKKNINLDVKSSQRVESYHSVIKAVKNRVTPVDEIFHSIKKLIHENVTKESFQTFKHRNILRSSIYPGIAILYSHVSKYCYVKFIKSQASLIGSSQYIIMKKETGKYEIYQKGSNVSDARVVSK